MIDLPSAYQRAHDLEQLVGLLGGEDRRRLVEDQDLGLAVQGLDDLHPLLNAHRQGADQRVGLDRQAILVRQGPDAPRRSAPVQRGADHLQGRIGSGGKEDGQENEQGDAILAP